MHARDYVSWQITRKVLRTVIVDRWRKHCQGSLRIWLHGPRHHAVGLLEMTCPVGEHTNFHSSGGTRVVSAHHYRRLILRMPVSSMSCYRLTNMVEG
jgi:hypothetical protein